MAKGKRGGTGHSARYTSYKNQNRWMKNREAKLQRALKLNPENDEIKEALKRINYRRKTPNARVWSHTSRETARLFKKFFGYVDPNILSSNRELHSAAMRAYDPNRQVVPTPGTVSFLLGARAHDGAGNSTWS